MMENETWVVHMRGERNIGYNLDGKIRRLSKITHQNILHVWCFTVFSKSKN
jgi:hypothetical protein